MSRSFKFRYVNEIVGGFVLAVVALLVVAIILAGRAQEWFVPVQRFAVDFPVEGSLGLQKGAEVQMLQAVVGRLEELEIDESGRMSGVFTVKGDFIRLVRMDSKAIVKRKFGVAGDAYIEITQGTLEPLPPDFTLLAVKDTEIIEVLEQMLEQLRATAVPAIEQVQKAVTEYTALAADLRNPEGPLLKLLSNLESITAGLHRGEGAAGQLLRDPDTAAEVKGIVEKINAALEDVKIILEDVRKTAAEFPPVAQKIGKESDNIPGLLIQTQETLREAERLIEGIQQHWIIRKYVPQPSSPPLIRPSEVPSS